MILELNYNLKNACFLNGIARTLWVLNYSHFHLPLNYHVVIFITHLKTPCIEVNASASGYITPFYMVFFIPESFGLMCCMLQVWLFILFFMINLDRLLEIARNEGMLPKMLGVYFENIEDITGWNGSVDWIVVPFTKRL